MTAGTHAHRDLYSYVADAINAKDDKGLRLGDLWYEAVFFIIAGSLAGPPRRSLLYTKTNAYLYRGRYIRHGPKCYIFLFIAEPRLLLKAHYRDPSGIPDRKWNLWEETYKLSIPSSLH